MIVWKPNGGGSGASADGVRAGRILEGARRAKKFGYGLTSLGEVHTVSNKRPRRLGRCFGSDMRTKVGRGSARNWVPTLVVILDRSGPLAFCPSGLDM